MCTRQSRHRYHTNNQQSDKQMSSQHQRLPPNLTPSALCPSVDPDDAVLVFTLNICTRPRAGFRWPEPNGLLALPNENQTLCCERVLRQETSIVCISGIGSAELFGRGSSSCAQLPLHSCVEALRSPGLEAALRLKGRRNSRAGIETELFYSGLDSEKFCFDGGRSCPRRWVYRVS